MKLNRVIVVHKGHSKGRDEIVAHVVSALEKIGGRAALVGREGIRRNLLADLIVTVGGDGTFLAAAHFAGKTPILGVNPVPQRSVGFFCAANAQNFEEVIGAVVGERLKIRRLPLMEAWIDKKRLPRLAVNDVLFAGATAAETVRYRIEIDGRSEEQKSSGVWVSAGPGSTAAIHSAGGIRMSVSSRRLQFVVREPYPLIKGRYHILRGILPQGRQVRIRSNMTGGMVYVDGHSLSYPVPDGSTLTVKIAREELRVFL